MAQEVNGALLSDLYTFLARLLLRKMGEFRAGFILENHFNFWRCATPLDLDRRAADDGHHENRKTDPLFYLLSHAGSYFPRERSTPTPICISKSISLPGSAKAGTR